MKATTESDYHHRIARVIEAILVDPGAPHTLESLASIAHFSPFHFHRIYRALTGESVAETVQRVRLAQAARHLTDASGPVSTVASDVGYDSPQAFARAFREFTGISPSTFQTRQQRLGTPQLDNETSIARSDEQSASLDWPSVELTELPPIDVLCLRHTGPIATIGQTFRSLLRVLKCDGETAKDQRMIGICTGDPELDDSFCYLAGIVPATPLEPVGAVEPVRLGGGLYATHRLVGPYALINPTFRVLIGGWLPQSGYEPDDRPVLEVYRNPPLSGLRHGRVTDLMIPIRKG
ncbi:AraC family transcriptional regulator [Paraburkholderia megapolitana]|uniref:AraC family transcriptional regulator n=1 Tax=Paraburkholderia megapolitana TaxID=420953 RepID=UPI0038BBA1DF